MYNTLTVGTYLLMIENCNLNYLEPTRPQTFNEIITFIIIFVHL